MKHFLIIPLGGLGTRFSKAGYKIYKPFLHTSGNSRIIDNIVGNFPSNKTHLILICNNKIPSLKKILREKILPLLNSKS